MIFVVKFTLLWRTRISRKIREICWIVTIAGGAINSHSTSLPGILGGAALPGRSITLAEQGQVLLETGGKGVAAEERAGGAEAGG